jgi:hypothetical protein
MTSISFDESCFVNEFMTEYDASGEQNFTVIFDNYLEMFLERTFVNLESILVLYYSSQEIDGFKKLYGDNIRTIASIQLYTKLFKVIERAFEENYYSDADTDIEN